MKTIVITGASSGIGRALALRAARAGYAVYAVGRNRDALAALATKIESEQGFVETDAVDIAVPEKARDVAVRALARFGSIDVLVNNAGFVSAGELVAQTDAELQRQFGTHVLGPLALVRESREALRAAHGHVFMLGSGVARIPVGGLGAYPPAKAALRSATAILRRELAAEGIAVTYVDPGVVDTPFMPRAGMPGAPAHLLVSPEDVARKILIAVGTRPRVLNAVPWQTAGVRLAEAFPNITEFVLQQAPALVGASEAGAAETPAAKVPAQPPAAAAETLPPTDAAVLPESEKLLDAPPSLDAVLEPHRRRMEKLNLSETFVRELLVPDVALETSEVAMRWAGMPNKNERAVTEEVLEALADGAFLERTGTQTYRVLRTP